MLQSVSWIFDHYGVGRSAEALVAGLPKGGLLALAALGNAGLNSGLVKRKLSTLSPYLMPLILLRSDKGGCVLLGRRADAARDGALLYQVVLPDIRPDPVELTLEELEGFYNGHTILIKPSVKIDTRAGEKTPMPAGHWLLSTLWRYRRYYYSAALGALLAISSSR